MTFRKTVAAAGALLALLGGCASLGDRTADGGNTGPRAQAVLRDAGFTGDIAIMLPDSPDTIYSGTAGPEEATTRTVEGWPWASVTKQVIAVLVMREVEDGRISLGSDMGQFVPRLRGRDLSVEDLLRHRSDLPNPDNTPLDESGFPSFYSDDADPLAFCTGQGEAAAEGSWTYNNCDYIVLGAMLEEVNDSSIDLLLAQGIGLQSGWSNTSFLAPGSERAFASRTDSAAQRIARYGTSAALVGPLDDMLLFDRALTDGQLLGPAALARLWQGDPAAGYMALGQWVFEAPLAGCDAPVRIVERRGSIGTYQTRNVILPDRGIAMALATDQGDFDFGEIWTGAGPLHDVLAAVACD
ncbi:serine hydrolase domain-containing protein [Aurantiacibacter hainanensis]|uniref:serine hydrolase domain-containing protein n=1 Tax=Aurantiacibacter hainanensis TaxID=3076114 RepID=UPI0030C748F8